MWKSVKGENGRERWYNCIIISKIKQILEMKYIYIQTCIEKETGFELIVTLDISKTVL